MPVSEVQFGIRLPRVVKSAVSVQARKEGKSEGAWIRERIIHSLKRHGFGLGLVSIRDTRRKSKAGRPRKITAKK